MLLIDSGYKNQEKKDLKSVNYLTLLLMDGSLLTPILLVQALNTWLL
jgi:hypothetical protein